MEYQVVMGAAASRILDRPVSKQMINEVLSMAIRAPSSLNTQPWNFYVVSGAPLDTFARAIPSAILQACPTPVSSEAMSL